MANETPFVPAVPAKREPSRIDVEVARLAGRQHGVVSRSQLGRLGMGRHAIATRLRRAHLQPVHRGVYAVGHSRLSIDGRWIAAVLAGGPGAVLSHRSAADLWEICGRFRIAIEVTVRRHCRSRDGVRYVQSALPSDETTTCRGIPVTGVARTIFDLAAVAGRDQVEEAIHEAEVRRLFDRLSLEDLLARHPHRRGNGCVRAVLEAAGAGVAVTRSRLEELFLVFLDRHGLPKPQVNAPIQVDGRWIEVDCLWRARRVIVELDGRAAHDTARAFEADRARDRALQVAGWNVVRITWRQLHDEPLALAADLRALIEGAR